MSASLYEKPMISLTNRLLPAARFAALRSWLLCWEIYPIFFVATFLRLYKFNTTEFERDMPDLFGMARYAVTHGMIPATSNLASIGIYNPPVTIDIFMLPAAFTNDPMWAAITVAIFVTISVLLTYGFVRCYYGRVAATIAALMYATLFRSVIYSRSIWNTNLLPLFTILFVMSLFWGAVARRKGWLFPALFLLGILIQLHATGALMIIPLGITVLLAPRTIRWRDLILGLLSLFTLFFPYLLWEISVHFFDVHLFIQSFQQKASFDDEAWLLYQTLFNPYDLLSLQSPFHWFKNIVPYLDESSMLWRLAPYLSWISQMLIYLVVTSMVTISVLAIWSWDSSPHEEQTSKTTVWKHVRRYWSRLRNSPYRCGLIVLFCWQVVPLIILLRHSLPLYQQYFMFLLPGPFILVGILVTKTAEWVRNGTKTAIPGHIQHYGLYATLAGLIIFVQLIGGILDVDHGHYATAFTAKPLLGAIIIDILMTVSTLLTYGFVHSYSSRIRAILAALMYALLFRAVVYSAVIFVVLFFMALLWGTVAHRKGWLSLALLLLGIAAQLQANTSLMILPFPINISLIMIISLVAAFVLARRAIRWRDLAFGLFALLISFLPSLLGEISLACACMTTTLLLIIRPWDSSFREEQATKTTIWEHIRHYWSRLCNTPPRRFLIMLFCWQIMPIIIFLYQPLPLYQQYLIFLLPVPCVASGISLAKTAQWLWSGERATLPWYIRRYGIHALAALIIIAQCIGSTVGVMDIDAGHYSNGFDEPGYPAYDLRFLRTALTKADQLAQQHHLNRVYIAADWSTQTQLQFLSPQMHTPAIIFSSSCLVLPSAAEGPAVMLIGPYSDPIIDLTREFAKATLIGKPIQTGGVSFWLYIVTPKPVQLVSHPLLAENSVQRGIYGQYDSNTWSVITSWTLVHSASPDYRTNYTYTMTQISPSPHQQRRITQSTTNQNMTTQCTFSAMRAGDHVLVPFDENNPLTGNNPTTLARISVKVQFDETKPVYLYDGPLTFLTFATANFNVNNANAEK